MYYGVPYISFIFSFLQVDLNSFPVKAVTLSVQINCGMPFSEIYYSKQVFAVFLFGACIYMLLAIYYFGRWRLR